jgi:Polyketide cyclase / dehydrase and lipid transport
MPRVSSTVTVPLDPARAFALSQTYGELRYRWDPFVREQRLLDGATAAAKGVRTWTRSRHRLTMVSEYVTFRPPGHVGMRMVRGPVFFRSFSGGWNFTALGPDESGGPRTEATWRYNFTIRPSWLAPVADRVGVLLLGRDIRRRLDAFAAACADPEIMGAVPTGSPPAA